MRPLETILLIDDEADIRTIARLSLERVGGLRVALASSGADGIALARQERPDAILLDVMMPGQSGLETLAQLRQPPTADIPVIFMTAKVAAEDLQRYQEAGAAGVIHKPFDPLLLPDQVRELLAGLP